MRILGGVPTRRRNTGGRVADWLSTVCDEVLVISQDADVVYSSPRVIVVERDANIGMMAARNEIFDYGIKKGFDVIVQSDDDLAFQPIVLNFLVSQIEEFPWIGSISSCPRVYMNWEKDLVTSHGFTVFQCPTQLWAVRAQAIKESGTLRIDVLEDIELGLRMWQNGWVLTRAHGFKNIFHNPVVSRIGKGDDSGGQPESLRKSLMPFSVDYIYEHHKNILSMFSISTDPRRTYMARYNWREMCKLAHDRWGDIGYSDSKGRII